MSKKPKKTQKTKAGAEIPVPTRADVLRDLKKVANPKPKSGDSAKK